MGDPECQPLMMRMESDLFGYIESTDQQSMGETNRMEKSIQSASSWLKG